MNGAEHISESPAQTQEIAASLARELTGGECIALMGEMGAGKTCFVRGMVAGLNGDPRRVSSPTYMLLNIYPTPILKVFHLDAYRVDGVEDFEAIGFSELLEQGGVVIVEWPQRVQELLPAAQIRIDIQPEGASRRRIQIKRLAAAGQE